MTAIALTILGLVLLAYAIRYSRRVQPQIRIVPAARPPRRQLRRDVPHALYEYDHATIRGRVYIGISNDPPARERRWAANATSTNPETRRKAAWWKYSTRRMRVVGWYPNWAAARTAEDAAIADAALRGEPIANHQGNPMRRMRRAA